MHEIRIGEKNVEYRDLSNHYLSRIFMKGKSEKYVSMKPITHILFPQGYSETSPSMLIECKGWVINVEHLRQLTAVAVIVELNFI